MNARHTKNLPGRKSDIAECQWLLKLHTFGLLNNSFQPSDAVRAMRTLWRHRAGLVGQASSAIQRMQKALIEMNIQLSNVLSDLSGSAVWQSCMPSWRGSEIRGSWRRWPIRR